MALLELRSVTSGYGRSVVLRDVSLDVKAGEIVALIGANGAGKSTLLNTIMGVVPLMGGAVAFDGRPLARIATPAIVRAGLVQVPERRQLFGTMTVGENLRMGAYVRERGEVSALLESQYALFPILRERRGQADSVRQRLRDQLIERGRTDCTQHDFDFTLVRSDMALDEVVALFERRERRGQGFVRAVSRHRGTPSFFEFGAAAGRRGGARAPERPGWGRRVRCWRPAPRTRLRR